MDQYDMKTLYINRETSWLAFNDRVLEEASNMKNPLFERLKFIAISSSNLDEFFMVRVAGLKEQEKQGYNQPEDKEKMSPRQQLDAISKRVHRYIERRQEILQGSILPELRMEGIFWRQIEELTSAQRTFIKNYYDQYIFPILTPLAIDASHPFPMLANKSLNLAVLLEPEQGGNKMFAVVQVPAMLPRFIEVPSNEQRKEFILLEEVISHYLDTLFIGNRILETSYFRITRNADMQFHEDTTEDLLEEIERELKNRKAGAAVRLEVAHSMSEGLCQTLRESLELHPSDVYSIKGPLDLTFFFKFYNVPDYDHLRYHSITPQPARDLAGEMNIFEAISRKDIMVFHPYESFEPVVHFINQAADDPNVFAIKQTLYRVSGHSPIVSALARAAENGKQVTVLLEIKARFDEKNNIQWAKQLEESGCHVIYGLVGLKTHSKITLVVRQEGEKIRRYVHLSTGNYNESTARVYTDIGLFTSREEFGSDASAFFNNLTGYATTPDLKQLTVAPHGLKEKFIALVENEIAKSTPATPGHIIAKMNSLTNKDMIRALFKASSAGVKIDLIIRGVCCLRPGIKGISENIRVYSIVGRFLEHSRIYYFRNGGDEQLFLSSADWMTRNLEHRVEILFPVIQENLKSRLKNILDVQLQDTINRHELQADGTYVKGTSEQSWPLDSQQYFYKEAQQIARKNNMFTVITSKTNSGVDIKLVRYRRKNRPHFQS